MRQGIEGLLEIYKNQLKGWTKLYWPFDDYSECVNIVGTWFIWSESGLFWPRL